MQVVFDIFSKSVLVSFRGTTSILRGPFATNRAAIAAGEAYCLQAGWKPDAPVVKT